MELTLVPSRPLDVDATLARYRLWGKDPANRIVGEAFLRVLRFDGTLVPYEVTWARRIDPISLRVRAPGARGSRVAEAIAREVRKVFGLDFDLLEFYRMAARDPVLCPIVEPLHGYRPTLAATALEMLVGAIVAQQVNLAFASVLRARLVLRYGERLRIGTHDIYAFPEARRLARARIEDLRAMQFSTRKAEYVRDVARAIDSSALEVEALAAMSNAEVIERLTALRGLGRWTADWFLARYLGRGDVCPAGDLAVRKAFARYVRSRRGSSEEAIRRRALRWGPHQNLAIHYLLTAMRIESAGARSER